MTTGIVTVSEYFGRLANAQTPRETHEIEASASAEKAYYHERGMYEESMAFWKLYLMARRKTTQLIKDGNMDVTQVGWSKMQWSRRVRELDVSQDQLDEYFDELIANDWHPSINGMIRHASGEEIDRRERAIIELKRGTRTLKKEYGMSLDEIHLLSAEVFIEG